MNITEPTIQRREFKFHDMFKLYESVFKRTALKKHSHDELIAQLVVNECLNNTDQKVNEALNVSRLRFDSSFKNLVDSRNLNSSQAIIFQMIASFGIYLSSSFEIINTITNN